MEPSQDFKSLQEAIQKSLVSTVKYVNRIAAEDLSFQRTVNPDTAEQLDEKTSRLLGLSTRLLQSAGRACGVKAPKLEEVDDVDMRWRAVVDVVDSILEKADTAMDEYTGLVKRKEPPNSESGPKSKKPMSTSKVIRNANVKKPQIDFEIQPDNFPVGPWKPIIKAKPHATVSLNNSLVSANNDDGVIQYKHPYENEILNMNYPDRIFQSNEPIPYQPDDSTSATWVETYEGVLAMLQELKEAKEIAIDLEHHDFRTYVGLVSLMQISTREKDWIVDTLKPWRHKLEILNEVFADPAIIKVFHGAYMDMVWLQRDLGLYVNGLFDTFFACDALNYPGRSLAFLLSKFVNFDADKQYQLADWRIRPIPDEMLFYARSDTHYLLYIYDCLRNELVAASDRSNPESDLIGRTLEKSRELSLSRHEHPDFNAETGQGSRGWYGFLLKNSHFAFNAEQFAVFRALWKWRDETARKEDESPNFVLGTSNLTEIARVNPPDAKALHSLLPITAPLARGRLNEIWGRIQVAKSHGGVSLLQFFTAQHAEITGQATSLPRVSKIETPLPEPANDVSVTALRRSQLFGDVAVSSRWEEAKQPYEDHEDYFPFPWQRFVQEGLQVEVEIEPAVKIVPVKEPVEEIPPVPTEAVGEQDEEFTLRKGRKRKSEAVDDVESETSEDSSESDGDEEMQDGADIISFDDKAPQKHKHSSKIDRKREQKATKKAQKDAKKIQRMEIRSKRHEAKHARKAQGKEGGKPNGEQPVKYHAVPFDYSTAASVLHTKRDEAQEQQIREEKKKAFDPYAKTGDDEIKPARKMPPVRGEKSATFKK